MSNHLIETPEELDAYERKDEARYNDVRERVDGLDNRTKFNLGLSLVTLAIVGWLTLKK